MKTPALLLLILTTIFASAEWTKVASLDRALVRLETSDTHLVAYTTNLVSTSTDGRKWSEPVDPGFPILHISQATSDDFVALSYARDPFSSNILRPYNIVIMDSTDGINWVKRSEIARFDGFALPTAGEIAVTGTHFVLTVSNEPFGFPEDITLYGNDLRIEESFSAHTNLLSLDGDIFGKGPVFGNQPCTFTSTLTSSELSSRFAFWRDLSGFLDLKTTSDGLLIGQNGISRKGGEIYYGNWKGLGEIKGYHNGVGLIATAPGIPPKLHLSRDFLRTWTEEDLPEPNPRGFLDAAFFNNQWFVLADSFSNNGLFSLPVAPVTHQVRGQAQLEAKFYNDRTFTIPGCKDNLTTSLGTELTFPDEVQKFYQVHTSTDLETWTAYGLPFPGATTHDFPIIPDRWPVRKIFFRAEELSIQQPN